MGLAQQIRDHRDPVNVCPHQNETNEVLKQPPLPSDGLCAH